MSESRILFTPYPCSGQDKCRDCFTLALSLKNSTISMSVEYRNRYNALLAAYCLDSDLRLGNPVVPLDFQLWCTSGSSFALPPFAQCFHDLRRKALSFDLAFVVVLPLVTDGFVFPTMSSL